MIKQLMVVIALVGILSGCAGMAQIDDSAQRKFDYLYTVDGATKQQLWKRARDYFAEAYGDSKSVFRILDENDGTIIGRGTATWTLTGTGGQLCNTDYKIRYAAKDGKARLQLELIDGVSLTGTCLWPLPSRDGHAEIVTSFEALHKALGQALVSSNASFKDF